MKNNYWMKLWFDILRDPKMGMLPDRLWRRVIELFLIAGQEGDDGLLPDVSTIAWQLNKPASAIVTDLRKIAETGIVVEFEPGKWMVTNFKKRNEPVDSVKRMKDFRHRERYEKSNVNATEALRDSYAAVTDRYQEAEEQKNRLKQEEEGGKSQIFKAWENEIGGLTSFISDNLISAVEDYSTEWVLAAIREAAEHDARNWKYVEAVLKGWKKSGYKVDTRVKRQADQPKTRKLRGADGEVIEVPA